MNLSELTPLWIRSKLTTSPLPSLLQDVNQLLSDTASWTFFGFSQPRVGGSAEMSPTSHDSAHTGHPANYCLSCLGGSLRTGQHKLYSLCYILAALLGRKDGNSRPQPGRNPALDLQQVSGAGRHSKHAVSRRMSGPEWLKIIPAGDMYLNFSLSLWSVYLRMKEIQKPFRITNKNISPLAFSLRVPSPFLVQDLDFNPTLSHWTSIFLEGLERKRK